MKITLTENQLIHLLCEDGSISQIVLECSKLITNKLIETYDNEEPIHTSEVNVSYYNKEINSFVSSQAKTKDYVVNVQNLTLNTIPTIKTAYLTVVETCDINVLEANYESFNIGGEARINSGSIFITVPSINGELKTNMLNEYVIHECEHFFQFMLGATNKNKKIYQIALQYLNSDNFILKCIANLIYFFDPRECDSKIHELYLDLKVAHGSFNECAQIKERDLCLKECFFPLLEMKKEIVSSILENIFQISYEKFFGYIKSQIHYFNKKAIRVYNKFAQDGKINEVKIIRTNKGFLIR